MHTCCIGSCQWHCLPARSCTRPGDANGPHRYMPSDVNGLALYTQLHVLLLLADVRPPGPAALRWQRPNAARGTGRVCVCVCGGWVWVWMWMVLVVVAMASLPAFWWVLVQAPRVSCSCACMQ